MQLAYESRTVTTPEELLDVLADIADDHDITCKWVEDHDYIDHMAEEMATTKIKRKQKLSAWLREFRGNLPVVYGVPVTDAPTPEPTEDPLWEQVVNAHERAYADATDIINTVDDQRESIAGCKAAVAKASELGLVPRREVVVTNEDIYAAIESFDGAPGTGFDSGIRAALQSFADRLNRDTK